jgi:hypothetical protein
MLFHTTRSKSYNAEEMLKVPKYCSVISTSQKVHKFGLKLTDIRTNKPLNISNKVTNPIFCAPGLKIHNTLGNIKEEHEALTPLIMGYSHFNACSPTFAPSL